MMSMSDKRTAESQSEDHFKRQRKSIDAGCEYDDQSDFEEVILPCDDHYGDWLFDERDSDLDFEDDFLEGVGEAGYVDEEDAPFYKEEEWGCLGASVCNLHQHNEQFDGTPFIQLFKVLLKFNDKRGGNEEEEEEDLSIDGKLSGEVVTLQPSHLEVDESRRVDLINLSPISYYAKRAEDAGEADAVYLDNFATPYVHLPLSDPADRPPIHYDNFLTIRFALRIDDKDIFNEGRPHSNPELFRKDDKPSAVSLLFRPVPPIRYYRREHIPEVERQVLGHPGLDSMLVCVKYSVYDGAWATVEVKMLKGGVGWFHGRIMARPCIFYSRIPLLTVDPGDMLRGHVGENSVVTLARSIVVVPSYASLIIGAELYDNDTGSKLICRGRTCFPAKENGEQTNTITYNGADAIQVKVKWSCIPLE